MDAVGVKVFVILDPNETIKQWTFIDNKFIFVSFHLNSRAFLCFYFSITILQIRKCEIPSCPNTICTRSVSIFFQAKLIGIACEPIRKPFRNIWPSFFLFTTRTWNCFGKNWIRIWLVELCIGDWFLFSFTEQQIQLTWFFRDIYLLQSFDNSSAISFPLFALLFSFSDRFSISRHRSMSARIFLFLCENKLKQLKIFCGKKGETF